MKLDEHMMRLIAVGASVSCNCLRCLEVNVGRARECGADENELAQAIWVGKMVRKGAASKMDDHIAALYNTGAATQPVPEADCVCKT